MHVIHAGHAPCATGRSSPPAAGCWRSSGPAPTGAARAAAYDGVARISFDGAQHRTDIAAGGCFAQARTRTADRFAASGRTGRHCGALTPPTRASTVQLGRHSAKCGAVPAATWLQPRRPMRETGPVTVPNVLATATPAPTWRDLVARAQDRARAAAVDRGAQGAARPRRRRARRRGRGLRGRRRQGRPRLDRRARAGDPPRREGADRGVQRARRPRAHPQGDDLARPDRERRAAPGPPVAGAAARPGRRGAGPAGAAGRRARRRW